MLEKELQIQIVELLKNESFFDAINNKELIAETLRINSDENIIPHLSIDDLLKKKYLKASSLVLSSLVGCEIVTGDMIKDISLASKESLFPDLILFNREYGQVILIENKVNSKTGREAITEIFGYMNEIRNHLPFISHYDVSIIIISTEFNTLLDHSISSNILSSNINLFCLTPNFTTASLTFDIHFPKSWTDIGQNNLPDNGLVSYSWGLTKKEIDFNESSVLNIAKEIIVNNANRYNSSGFLLVWENGLKEYSGSEFVITVYVVNPFAFLPNADKFGFQYRNTALANYLKDYGDDYGGIVHPESLFKIMADAKRFLEDYFTIEIDTASDWISDIENETYRIQRKPMLFDSWGLVGDYVRYFYFHPAVRKSYFGKESDNYLGHLSPVVGLEIINIITKNVLFENGHFHGYDLFKFGKQLARYNYACLLCTSGGKKTSNDALLFWSILEISQSLKEIKFYSVNTKGLNAEIDLNIHLPLNSKDVKANYREKNDEFAKNFQKIFLADKGDWLYRRIFEFGYHYGLFFSDFWKQIIKDDDIKKIESEIGSFVRKFLNPIIESVINKQRRLNDYEIAFVKKYFYNEDKVFIEKLPNILKNISDKNLTRLFPEFLTAFSVTISIPYKKLNDLYIPETIDWEWMKESVAQKFNAGYKRGVINCEPNGSIGISQIQEEFNVLGDLQNENEVYLKTYSSTVGYTIRKVLWEDVKSGKAFAKG